MNKQEKEDFGIDYILIQDKIHNALYQSYLLKNPNTPENEYIEYYTDCIRQNINSYIKSEVKDKEISIHNANNILKYYEYKLNKSNVNALSETIINNKEDITEEKTPYKIALLKELGFFELNKIKSLSKENVFRVIQKLTGGTPRTIKGNVNVFDEKSNEDRMKYTSNNHIEEVKNYLDKLK